MADDANDVNRIEPAINARSIARGDSPDWIRRRYLLDERGGRGLGFYLDATSRQAVFRDRGDRLTTGRNDPNAIRHMAEIAHHRGWSTVTVRGDTGFRREAWMAAAALGLEVRGYRATERDLQALQRRRAAREAKLERAGPKARLDVFERVVRARVGAPDDQARILAAARDRMARWLERGAAFAPLRETERPTVRRERER